MKSTTFSIIRSLFVLSLILGFISLTSCGDDDDSVIEQDVPCAETIFYELKFPNLSSRDRTQAIDDIDGTGPSAAFQLIDPSPFDSDKVSRVFTLISQSSSSIFNITLEINVEDAESCIPLGVYDSKTLSSSEGSLSFTFSQGFNTLEVVSFVVRPDEGSGVLEITNCDFEKNMISGNFNGILVAPNTGESIQINNGIFENVCLSQ